MDCVFLFLWAWSIFLCVAGATQKHIPCELVHLHLRDLIKKWIPVGFSLVDIFLCLFLHKKVEEGRLAVMWWEEINIDKTEHIRFWTGGFDFLTEKKNSWENYGYWRKNTCLWIQSFWCIQYSYFYYIHDWRILPYRKNSLRNANKKDHRGVICIRRGPIISIFLIKVVQAQGYQFPAT